MTSPQQCNAPWHTSYTYCRTRDLPANTATALAIYIYLRPARLSGAASEFLSDKAQLGSFAGLKNQLCPFAISVVYIIFYSRTRALYVYMYICVNLQYLQRGVYLRTIYYVFRCTLYEVFDAQFWLKLHIHITGI